MAQNRTFDFTIPALLRRVTFFGNVHDGTGQLLADVAVTAYSQSITGAPNVGFAVSGKTDTRGNYSIFIPDGTDYELTLVPPGLNP
jgi:hypothetical protein